MAIYLLDFENVHDSGITGVTSLTENDELCIFYSVKSEHMSFETHVNIMKTAAKVKYIKLRRAAKNYLDFQLCTHLGYIIGAGFEGPFYIISKDTGYDSAIDYWKDHGVTIIRQPAIGFNRNLGKSTGQNPAHNTPPALVTFKQGNVITNPDVQSLYKLDTGAAAKDEAVKLQDDEPILPAEAQEIEAVITEEEPIFETEAAAAENAALTEEIAAPAAAERPSTSSGKKKKSRSQKAAAEEDTTASANADAVSEEPKADVSSVSEESMDSSDKEGSSKEEEPAAPSSGGRSSRQNRSRRGGSKKAEQVSEVPAPQDSIAQEPEAAPQPAADHAAAVQPEASEAETVPANEEDSAQSSPAKAETLPESYRKRVRTALKGRNIPSAYYASIYKAILNSYDKLALNNLLVKTFGSSKGGEVYKQIKEIFTDYQS